MANNNNNSPSTQQQQPDPNPPKPDPPSLTPNPNPNPNLLNQPQLHPPPPQPQIQQYGTVFRPPQFNPNPTFQMQPPGVAMMPGQQYAPPPMRMYAPPPPNGGYPQVNGPPGAMNHPPGLIRYPSPYPQMIRPGYPQRPLGPGGVIPALQRPPIMPMRGPVIPTIIRPPINLNIAPVEKPMTTIYVGKIASTVDNDFMLSLLQLCGPVKSWKRVPDPTTGALKGFGFCEFESVEGVLRALRLLSKLSIDGQELMLNFDKATKEYLKRYIEKKKENLKNQKAADAEGAGKEEDKKEPLKPSVEESKDVKKEDDYNEENKDNIDYATFGLVTDEDKEADKEASEKLIGMIEERIKNEPLPPPPPPPQAPVTAVNMTSELPTKSRDGDSDADMATSLCCYKLCLICLGQFGFKKWVNHSPRHILHPNQL